MEHDIAFSPAKLQVRLLDWTMDARKGVPDRCYEEIRRLLLAVFPEAKVRVIVRTYYAERGGIPYSLGFAKVTLRNDRYLGADMLPPEEVRAASLAIAQTLVDQLHPQIRDLLHIYRATPAEEDHGTDTNNTGDPA